jgi:hypothetical protein
MMLKIFKYKVKGTWEFPFDMLRYDRCWPLDSGIVGLKGTREINIEGLNPPTIDRWNSFGWAVEELGCRKV